MRWNHSRKGTIEGEIVEEKGDFVDIKLTNKVWMGNWLGYSEPGEVITVRKSFLQPLEKEEA